MVRLIPLDPHEHAELLFGWRQQPDVARFMYSQKPILWEDHLGWLAGASDDRARCHWVIEHASRPVGSASLAPIDSENRRAVFGMYVAESGARLLGVGAAAEFLVLEQAFGPLELAKVSCEIFAVNEAPLRMHHRMGFVEEGLLRRHARFEGEWVDVHLLSILRGEWAAKRSDIAKHLRRLLPAEPLSAHLPAKRDPG